MAGPVVLVLLVIRKLGRFAARTWLIVLSTAVAELIWSVLYLTIYTNGFRGRPAPEIPRLAFWYATVTGFLSGGTSILIENRRAKRFPRKVDPQLSRPMHNKTAPAKTAASIFVSYRRTDSADVTGRIYDRLTEHFGRERIFKDVDSIPLGVNFKQHLENAVMECRLLLVIIGQRWTGREGGSAKSNITDPIDFVRIELETAIRRSLPIIPVLVQGARMPRPEDLPDSLQALVYYNAIEVRPDPDFHSDVTRLIAGIEGHLK